MSTFIATQDAAIERSPRHRFLELLAGNPNYFGNLGSSAFQPVTIINNDAFYEQLTCLGYNPDSGRLEAVMEIKQPTGYNGALCQNGSYEYVRFFVDYGAGFEDAGVAAANVHDVPNGVDCREASQKPLKYAVSVLLTARRNRCTHPVLPRVRAILSWNAIPTAGDPGYTPVWGGALEAQIQIKPRLLIFKDVVASITNEAKLILPPEELEQVFQFPIPLPDPQPLDLAKLAQLYSSAGTVESAEFTEEKAPDEKVPAHRFGFVQLHAALHAVAADPLKIESNINVWQKAGLNWQDGIASIAELKGNVSYEQLECVGLEGGSGLERLVANFAIKRPLGYGGGLCAKGSVEYVAFWADWDNTCEFTHVGTVGVPVHDIARSPLGALSYTATLPVDLSAHRQSCETPHIARVRAVLSWAVPPSATNPDAVASWGNIVDAHVQIQPGTPASVLNPTLGVIGGIPVTMIDASTGLTTSNAAFALQNTPADSYGRACPFGGRVTIQGDSFPGYKYQISVQPFGGGTVKILDTPLMLVRVADDTTYMSSPDASGFFAYVDPEENFDRLLAQWDTGGDDKWVITLQVADSADNILPGAVYTHVLQLDNTAPQAAVHIDSNGDCGRFPQGVTLDGHFVAWDVNFGSFSLGSLPFTGPVTPGSGETPTAPLPSTGDAWSLDTSSLQPCGYVVQLNVADLSIVNSEPGVHNWATTSVGFCLMPSGM